MLTRDAKRFPLHLKATGPNAHADRVVPTAAEGRICAEPGCSTLLSVYNDRARCWLHDPWRPFVQHLPRKPPPHADDAEVLRRVDEPSSLEPAGPPDPPPVPQPEPGSPPPEHRRRTRGS